MPSSLSRHQRSKYKRNTHNDGTGRSISGDSGVLSREGSCASLAATNHVADEIARIKLENSPCQHDEQGVQRMNDENMQTINRYNREAKINPDNSVLVEIKLTGEQFELVKSGKYVVSLCAADSVGNLNGGDPRLELTNWNAKQAAAPVQQQQQATNKQQNSTQRKQIQSRRAPPTYDSLNPSDYIDDSRITNPQSIRKRTQYNHPFSPLSSESSGLGQSYDSPPSEMPVKQTQVMIQSNIQQQQRRQTPMLTNNNDVDYDEQQFKLDSDMASTSRTTSVDNAPTTTTTGMELTIESNADGILFDDLYNDLNLYELNDIYDMPLN